MQYTHDPEFQENKKTQHTVRCTGKPLQPAFQQRALRPPAQCAGSERRLQGLLYCPHEGKLHHRADFEWDVMFHVLAIRPRQDDLCDVCSMGTKHLLLNAADSANPTT